MQPSTVANDSERKNVAKQFRIRQMGLPAPVSQNKDHNEVHKNCIRLPSVQSATDVVKWGISKFSAFGGVPSGPACFHVGILPLWLGAFGERGGWRGVVLLVVDALAGGESFCG